MCIATIPPPKNISVKVLCDRVNISWSLPKVLQGYHIEGYTLNLKNSNVTYFTNETTLTIMFNDTLVISEHYQIEITGHYCGGIGNASLVSFIVADGKISAYICINSYYLFLRMRLIK